MYFGDRAPQVDSLWQFVSGRVLLGLGHGTFLPAARRTVIVMAGADAGAALGKLGVYSAYGPVLLFAGQAVIMMVTLLGACWLGREQLRPPSSTAAGEEHPSFPPTS
jgi:hypothetical protein